MPTAFEYPWEVS